MTGAVPCRVRVRVRGELSAAWWGGVFTGLSVTPDADGTTVVEGQLADDAALYGLLAAIRDLGIPLVSVETASGREER